MRRYLSAFSNLLDLYIDAPREVQEEVVDAWGHCRSKGSINGCKAPKEIRRCVSEISLSIRAEPDPEMRAQFRADVTRALIDRARKRLRKKLRRALE